MNSFVMSLTVFDDGTGPALYAGGLFTMAGGLPANHIAKWHGGTWTPLAGGTNGTFGEGVYSLAVFDDGAGPALYAAGQFTIAGDVPANSIAKWDGATWTALGSGMGGLGPAVFALTVFDDGTGPALYVGGGFTTAGGVPANLIARWNGRDWFPVGGGMSSADGNAAVFAFTQLDDGTGLALYAGGTFAMAGDVTANHIAKWNGATWTALGSGMNNSVRSLAVFDEGTGPTLYAGGYFFMAGGMAANHIAKWDGTSWTPLANGTNGAVLALAGFNDGMGPALFVGGDFTLAGGLSNFIGKWGPE